MFFVKLIFELVPFIWECFFGKKIPKEPPSSTSKKEKDLALSVGLLKKLLHWIQTSRKVALGVVLLLVASLFLNYYFGNRIIALARDENRERPVGSNPAITQPEDNSHYYENLLSHLEATYQSTP